MELVLQFLVLGFTGVAWWAAKRDLSRQAAAAHAPAAAEWDRLRRTVEELIGDLERRAAAAEQRVTLAEQRLLDAEQRLLAAPNRAALPAMVPEPRLSGQDAAAARGTSVPAFAAVFSDSERAAHDVRYAPIYTLVAAGVTDTAEIARRTGFGQGEVELILGLHARQG